jgi:TolA-binding protein
LALIVASGFGLQACSALPSLLDDKPSTPAGTTAEPSGVGAGKTEGVSPDLTAADKTEPVADLYNKGLAKLKDGQYKTAAKQFEEVERQPP